MENIILSLVTPFILPALAVNVILDVLKKQLKKKVTWLMPVLCVVLSIIIPIGYSFLPIDNKPDDILTQIFGIMSISYFVYDSGGYTAIKKKLVKGSKDEQN